MSNRNIGVQEYMDISGYQLLYSRNVIMSQVLAQQISGDNIQMSGNNMQVLSNNMKVLGVKW